MVTGVITVLPVLVSIVAVSVYTPFGGLYAVAYSDIIKLLFTLVVLVRSV